jgi:hypothetical protein
LDSFFIKNLVGFLIAESVAWLKALPGPFCWCLVGLFLAKPWWVYHYLEPFWALELL